MQPVMHHQIPPNQTKNSHKMMATPSYIPPQHNSGRQKKTNSAQNTKTSGKGSRKRKIEEKENLDPEFLAKLKSKEWESRTGYWCQRCKIRFSTSDELVDHMAKNVHSGPPTNAKN